MRKNKKIRISIVLLLILSLLTVCSCDLEHNRYASMEVIDGVLYYYANGYINQYKQGKSKEYKKAKSNYFRMEKIDDELKIHYDMDGVTTYKQTPYDKFIKTSAVVVYDQEHVYARYPGGKSHIVVYKIIYDEEGKCVKLQKEDEIRY